MDGKGTVTLSIIVTMIEKGGNIVNIGHCLTLRRDFCRIPGEFKRKTRQPACLRVVHHRLWVYPAWLGPGGLHPIDERLANQMALSKKQCLEDLSAGAFLTYSA
jgi:hypothetical protein